MEQMTDEISNTLYLDGLKEEVPDLAVGKASMMKEACVWCLFKCGHSNGVPLFSIFCDDSRCYKIQWDESEIDEVKVIKSYNLDDAVEFGAEAVTFLLIRDQTSYTAIERSVKGTGIDYWLGYKSEDPNSLFSNTDARLEVSGILKEKGSNTVKKRLKTKINQTKPTDKTFPVYVSIVEFGKPKAEMVKKDVKH